MIIQGLKAWGRFCKCLGQKFQPYMEVAIPCLLQSAGLTLPDDGNIEESDDERMIQIKTEFLEEKATACVLKIFWRSMARFSRALGGRFLKKILSSSDVSLKVKEASVLEMKSQPL
ncbi:hypothetical protein OIU85_004527 [Salix viminalis]|uniref:Uncharacterized protein n=1 Tax=Salix viminalis TaxID=40686 RepID=A0A9Q0PTE2_SALVM|nr:hypothetical protein OIU85_004527 [Salix viminalis]